jgi:CRISPR-associated protein Cas2
MKLFVVISYDIQDTRRRNRILKTLKDYGQHVQYSVFECLIEKEHFLVLQAKLAKQYDLEAGDSVRFYVLCEQDVKRIERLGGIEPLPTTAIFA